MNLIANTKGGKIKGFFHENLICFRSIPYALPPKKNLRFKPPQPTQPWKQVFNADKYGSIAPQIIGDPSDELATRKMDEDCLNLDIWSPALTPKELYPVFVWIHGGGFIQGNSSISMYDCHSLSAHGKIVSVSINYRLGVLGMLYHPELKEKGSEICGNFAFLDQIAALKWISENINAFGGDPKRITLCGESAGGSSVAIHLQSPLSLPYFQQAISESGAPQTLSPEYAIKAAECFFADVGIKPKDKQSLLDLPYETILKASNNWSTFQSFGLTACRPVQDGVIIPYTPIEAVKRGMIKDKIILFGTNRDEAKFLPLLSVDLDQITEKEVKEYLTSHIIENCQKKAEIIDKIYQTFFAIRTNRGELTTPAEILLAIVNENYLRWPISEFLDKHFWKGGKGYNYLFTWESPNPKLGSCHVLEIPFVLGTLLTAPGMEKFAGSGEPAENLMHIMQNAWSDFIWGRNPGMHLDIDWPIYDPKKRSTMIFGKTCKIEQQPLEEERQILEKFNITFYK